ncbi:hypothetical protein [Streptomyces sp. NPDC015130]|uniref:hypothetical protein n=1 Tax=Streptomyces sp. NPDC015130 TaxID=3364940 RepID=UPI0036F53E4E
MVTLADVARHTRVSAGIVSRVPSGKRSVSAPAGSAPPTGSTGSTRSTRSARSTGSTEGRRGRGGR